MQSEPDTRVLPKGAREAEAEAPPQAPKPRASEVRRVGRYELVRKISRGGMATVYVGRATGKAGFEKIVAVKVIHPHLADEPEFVRMFLDEARIAARLHHPHVVETLDLGEAGGEYFMVMELVEGENLAALTQALGEEKLPLSVSLQIIADALAGLGAAHELEGADGEALHLVHRDVSPHNLLVTLSGWVKVADFGIVKAVGKASSTKTGELRGKLAYMSPEQARGAALDDRSDLFALGVILWELIRGGRLFARGNEAATLERVIACEIPPIRVEDRPEFAEDPVLFEAVQALLARALAPERTNRFESAAQMATALKKTIRRCADATDNQAEPRAQLAALMRQHFAKRVAYIRAALRDAAAPTEAPARSPSAHELENLARRAVAAALEETHAVTPSGQTGSTPGGDSSASLVPGATMTGTVAGPIQRWGTWLLLPMIGAAIAVVVMTRFTPSQATEESRPAAEVAPTLAPSETVTWYFATNPEGADIFVAGEKIALVTPAEVEVARADDPVEIRFEAEGRKPLKVRLKPVNDQSYHYDLRPVPGPTPAPAVETPEEGSGPKIKRPKPKGGGGKGAGKGTKSPPKGDDPKAPQPDGKKDDNPFLPPPPSLGGDP